MLPFVLRHKGDVGIARNVHAIEWLKTEIIGQLGSLFGALMTAKEDAVVDSMAAIVSCCYLLARRVGIRFSRVDARIDQRLRSTARSEHQLETWYGDLTALMDYRDDAEKGRG